MLETGGEIGIRTLDTVAGTLAFEASSFNHSDISPHCWGVVCLYVSDNVIRMAEITNYKLRILVRLRLKLDKRVGLLFNPFADLHWGEFNLAAK